MDCYQFCYHPQSKKPRKSLIYKAFSILAERVTANIVSNIVRSNPMMNLKSLIHKHL